MLKFSLPTNRIAVAFFNTSGVEKVSALPTMDATMDTGIRNLRFRAVLLLFFLNRIPSNIKSMDSNISKSSF